MRPNGFQSQPDVNPQMEYSTSKEKYQVFVRGLPLNLTETQLSDYMSNFGTVTKVNIMKRKDRSLGYGFVTMGRVSDVERAVGYLDHKISGSILILERVDSKELVEQKKEEVQKRKVFVRGFQKKLGEESLREYFKKYGEVETVFLNKYQSGESKRTAFVVFKDKQDAINLLEKSAVINHELMGNELKVYESFSKNQIKEYGKKQKKNKPNGNEKIQSKKPNQKKKKGSIIREVGLEVVSEEISEGESQALYKVEEIVNSSYNIKSVNDNFGLHSGAKSTTKESKGSLLDLKFLQEMTPFDKDNSSKLRESGSFQHIDHQSRENKKKKIGFLDSPIDINKMPTNNNLNLTSEQTLWMKSAIIVPTEDRSEVNIYHNQVVPQDFSNRMTRFLGPEFKKESLRHKFTSKEAFEASKQKSHSTFCSGCMYKHTNTSKRYVCSTCEKNKQQRLKNLNTQTNIRFNICDEV